MLEISIAKKTVSSLLALPDESPYACLIVTSL